MNNKPLLPNILGSTSDHFMDSLVNVKNKLEKDFVLEVDINKKQKIFEKINALDIVFGLDQIDQVDDYGK
ncbi:MAG: hypothetical protein J1F35_06420 [Erysipelotrichales bacterium]|nr:hypothetical protein [Erysipelotrichales bacterium]